MNHPRERNVRQCSAVEEPDKTPAKRLPIAPLRAGEEIIQKSLSMLQGAIADPLRDNAKAFLLLKSKCLNKQKQVEKMSAVDAEKEFFPRSTRFKFEISASKEAAEVEEFKLLKQQSEEKVVEMKRAFKAFVIRATKIEMDVMHQKLRSHFITFTRNIVKAIALTIELELDPDIIIYTILQKHPELLVVMKATPQKFNDEYKSIHKIVGDLQGYTGIEQTNPTRNPTRNSSTNSAISPYFSGQRPLPTTTTTDISPTMNKINFIGNALKIAYLDPWKKYEATHKENILNVELNKIINTKLGEEANTVTEMELDGEATLDAPTIAELITKKTTEATKNLTKEIQVLNNRINQLKNSKKEKRGQPSSGASAKKQIAVKKVTFQKTQPSKEKTNPQKSTKKLQNTKGNKRSDSSERKGRSRSRSSRRR